MKALAKTARTWFDCMHRSVPTNQVGCFHPLTSALSPYHFKISSPEPLLSLLIRWHLLLSLILSDPDWLLIEAEGFSRRRSLPPRPPHPQQRRHLLRPLKHPRLLLPDRQPRRSWWPHGTARPTRGRLRRHDAPSARLLGPFRSNDGGALRVRTRRVQGNAVHAGLHGLPPLHREPYGRGARAVLLDCSLRYEQYVFMD